MSGTKSVWHKNNLRCWHFHISVSSAEREEREPKEVPSTATAHFTHLSKTWTKLQSTLFGFQELKADLDASGLAIADQRDRDEAVGEAEHQASARTPSHQIGRWG